jgi:hypothetical protein
MPLFNWAWPQTWEEGGRWQLDEAGRIAPRFVTSSDVRDEKIRLNPTVEALDFMVANCPDMPDVLKRGWEQFSISWKAFMQQAEGFWSAGAEMDQAEAFAADIQAWNAKLSAAPCKSGKPSEYTPPAPSADAPTDQSIGDITGTVKLVTVIGGLVALAYYADKAGIFGRR